MKNSADFGYTFTCRSYGAECLFDLVSINMTPLTGLETASLSSPRIRGGSGEVNSPTVSVISVDSRLLAVKSLDSSHGLHP